MKSARDKMDAMHRLITGISRDLECVDKQHFEAHINREQAVLYTMGELAPSEADRIDYHLSVCEACCRTQLNLEEGLGALEDPDRASRLKSAGNRALERLNDPLVPTWRLSAGSPGWAGQRTSSPLRSEKTNLARTNPIARFLLFCSGASRSILEVCPAFEVSKYVMIGAMVFFTGIFATLASGYALYRIFFQEPYALPLSVVLAILWGSFVFVLDRFIVSTARNEGDPWRRFVNAVPRLGVAVVISIVIATPFRVLLFEDRIAREIDLVKQREAADDREFYRNRFDLPRLAQEIQAETNGIANPALALDSETSGKHFQDLMRRMDRCIARQENMRKEMRNEEPAIRLRISEEERKIYLAGKIRQEAEASLREAKSAWLGAVEELSPHNVTGGHDVVAGTAKDTLQERKGDATPSVRELEEEVRQARDSVMILVEKRTRLRQQLENLQIEFREQEEKCAGVIDGIREERSLHRDLLRSKLAHQEARLLVLEEERESASERANSSIARGQAVIDRAYSENFLTQIEAMGELSDNPFSAGWWTSWSIMFLFLMVETAPILVKLLSKKGPYDKILTELESESRHVDLGQLNRMKATAEAKKEEARVALEANRDILVDFIERTYSLLEDFDKRSKNYSSDMEVSVEKSEDAAREDVAGKSDAIRQAFLESIELAIRGYKAKNKEIAEKGFVGIDP